MTVSISIRPSAASTTSTQSTPAPAASTSTQSSTGYSQVSTFESAPPASPPAAQIDPRIAGRISVGTQTAGANGTFRVATVRYQDDVSGESGGNHNVYVRVLDAQGREVPPDDVAKYFDVKYVAGDGQPVLSGTPKLNDPSGVKHDAWANSQNTGGPTAAYADIPLWADNQTRVWIEPKNVPGNPYAGFGSQSVGPFTMPGHHHVNYLVSFQAAPGGAQPAPQPAPPPAPVQPAPPGPADLGPAAARIDAYAATRQLGAPTSSVHTWNGLTVRDYARGPETEGPSMVVDGPRGAQLVRNSFHGAYVQGDTASRLGAPLEPEHWENGQVIQRFEHGSMTWTPERGVTVNAPPAAAPASQPLGDLVESVYRSELGRASDPGGKASWVGLAQTLRARGIGDDQLRALLLAMFDQSAEYRATH